MNLITAIKLIILLEQELNSSSTDYESLEATSKKLGEVISTLNQKSNRWLELSEFVG